VDLVPVLLDAASTWGGPGLLLGALAQIGPACIPHLIQALEKPASLELRAVLLLALGRMGAAASRAAPAVSRFLNDSEPAIAITAARALARIDRTAKRPDGFPPILRPYGVPLLRSGGDAASRIHGSLCARKQ
jgi:HEAT repeat protein